MSGTDTSPRLTCEDIARAAPSSLRKLLPQHNTDLRNSGLNAETLNRWGVYSIETDQRGVLSQLGFGHLDPPCLALPIIPPDRNEPNLNEVMLKPDLPRRNEKGQAIKYEARKRSHNRIHAPLSIRPKVNDSAVPLVITEGQKKAEKAAQEGLCCVALFGVWSWHDRIGDASFPIGDFDLIPLEGRTVCICFDSDAASNTHVQAAERALASFLTKRGARVRIKRLPPLAGGAKCGLDDFLLTHTAKDFHELPDLEMAQVSVLGSAEWPNPSPLGDDLPPVDSFALELLPASLRPLVEDVSDRMQTPPDFAAIAGIVALAGCVNRRARVYPKVEDNWTVTPNLWGTIIAHPGFMKSPILRAMTAPLAHIEETWRAEYESTASDFEIEKEKAELRFQAWRESYKAALKKKQDAPMQPDNTLKEPTLRRLLLTDSTFEALHQILADNSAGVIVTSDELTGWIATLDRPGREGERAFFLQSWNGDSGFTIDRIGRGSIYVPAVCVSLLGCIQPARLRWYLSQSLDGGPSDDGLLQRFQLATWPDAPRDWKLIDRTPNNAALATAEKVFTVLANLPADSPIRLHFDPEAQQLFFVWWAELERKIRGEAGLHPALIAHLAKYRSLLPTLAGLFELADAAAESRDAVSINLTHTQQAAALCEYLESHAKRIYSCVTSPDVHAGRLLAGHIEHGDLPETFSMRELYRHHWAALDTAERAKGALDVLGDAGWVRAVEQKQEFGRPPDTWKINPKVVRRVE